MGPPAALIEGKRNVFVLVDIMPYAREVEKPCRIVRDLGFEAMVFSEVFDNWAYSSTNRVFHAKPKNVPFLNSTASLNSLPNIAVHVVAERDPETARAGIDTWIKITKEPELF